MASFRYGLLYCLLLSSLAAQQTTFRVVPIKPEAPAEQPEIKPGLMPKQKLSQAQKMQLMAKAVQAKNAGDFITAWQTLDYVHYHDPEDVGAAHMLEEVEQGVLKFRGSLPSNPLLQVKGTAASVAKSAPAPPPQSSPRHSAEKIRLLSSALRAHDAGDLVAAKRNCDQLILMAPDDPSVLRLVQAVDRSLQAHPALLQAYLKTIQQVDPETEERLVKGLTKVMDALRASQLERAEKELRELERLAPDNASVQRLRRSLNSLRTKAVLEQQQAAEPETKGSEGASEKAVEKK